MTTVEDGCLVVRTTVNPQLRIALAAVYDVTAIDGALRLRIGDLVVELAVAAGETAAALAMDAAAYTRKAFPRRRAPVPYVWLGDVPLVRQGTYLIVGTFAYRADQVRAYALAGENIQVPDLGYFQAAVGLLALRRRGR